MASSRLGPPIHPSAAEGFARAAEAYERGRPAYPPEAIAALFSAIGCGGSGDHRLFAILDLGAGTGKLTRMLVPSGARILALEPVEGMRRKLAELLPDIEVKGGAAEAIPLPDGSVDAVTAGQAFHWFQGEPALAEIHRVLKPSGHLALLWNARDASVDWVSRLADIIAPYGAGTPHYTTLAWRRPFVSTRAFSPLALQTFRFEQCFDAIDPLVDRIASISYIAALDEPTRARVLQKVRDLAETHPALRDERPIRMPYETRLYTCARRESPGA
jgi:SAM-dependent methyltransferase